MQVALRETAKISDTNTLSVKINKKDVSLLGTDKQFKQNLLNTTSRLLFRKKIDLEFVNNKIRTATTSELEGKSKSIFEAIKRISNEVEVILQAAALDKQFLYNPRQTKITEKALHLFPIGKEDVKAEVQLSNNEILDKIIAEDMLCFEKKMYSVLTSNSAEIVVPVLKDISERFGYRLTKIPVKK